jgi:hypothetical protein
MKTRRLLPLLGLLALFSPGLRAALVNVGAVALNPSTGYYLQRNGGLNTTGEILVGYFNTNQASLESLISGWSDSYSTNNANGTTTRFASPTYDHYAQLNGLFTQIGTGATGYGSTVPGWSFTTNGTVSGTSSNIDTSVVPASSQLYVWAFNTSSFTSNNFTPSTQWGLFTATNWSVPSLGAVSLNLASVTAATTLIGTDLDAIASNSVVMVPEPATNALLVFGSLLLGLQILRASGPRSVATT